MKYSQLYSKTLREVPQDIKYRSHEFLVRAGFIRGLGNGLFSFLPLGMKLYHKIRKIIEDEMIALGGQEVLTPLINPEEIWLKSGRYKLVDKDLVKFHDRSGRELVLAPTHEEAIVELVRADLNSYRDFPVFLYQFQTKFRDEEKTRYGLIRTKEFIMKDAYSFHRSASDLNNFFPKVFGAYQRIFKKVGLEVIAAESGVGYMGGSRAYEFLMRSPWGENTIIVCDRCGYKANHDVAVGLKEYSGGMPLEMKEVSTPGCTTMERLSKYLELPKSSLAKTMVFKAPSGLVMAVVRGDYEVSPDKLSNYLKFPVSSLASNEELERFNLVPGFVSPIEVSKDIIVVVDENVADSANLVLGANKKDTHYTNVNFGRDFDSEFVGDISLVRGGDLCRHCEAPLKEVRAVEVGNIFKLDNYYTKSMDLAFQDDKIGGKQYPYMGSYGIGIGRLIATIVETNSDEKGIIWPFNLAPFAFYLMAIGKSLKVKKVVNDLYEKLGDYCLFDDRLESISTKFKDADLIGIPFRIVVAPENLKNGVVEFRDRRAGDIWLVSLDDFDAEIKRLVDLYGLSV